MKPFSLVLFLLVASNYCHSQCVASFSVNTSDSCLNGNSYDFVNTSTTSSGTLNYDWNFGDSTSINYSANPTHSYAKAGSYTIKLGIESSNGCTAYVTKQVTVYPTPVVGPIVGDTVICLGQSSYFTDSTGGGDWGVSNSNGELEGSINPNGLFTTISSGVPTVYYTVTSPYGCGTAKASTNVYISANIVPTINIATDNTTICPDSCATFRASSIIYGGVIPAIQWQLNGLNVGTGQTTYTYCGAKAGYKVSCFLDTASIPGGCFISLKSQSNVVSVQTIAPPTITGDSVLYVGGKDTLHITSIGSVWQSSNTTVATVDSNGIVTAHTAGVVVITDSVTSDCGKSLETFNISVVNPMSALIDSYQLIIDKNEVLNSWVATNEVNISYYNIQRSTNSKDFTIIGTLAAKGSGNYSFIDQAPLSAGEGVGVRYYRLESVDKDGKMAYSKVLSASLITHNSSLITISPNPSKDVIAIEGINLKEIQIIDLLGKVVIDRKTTDTNTTINVQSLRSGLYLVKGITNNNSVTVNKFIKH